MRDEVSNSVKGSEFFDRLINYQLLKEDSTAWSE
jgi:hypothetical protein